MNTKTAIKVSDLSKAYRIWRDSKVRLKSPLVNFSASLALSCPLNPVSRIGVSLKRRLSTYYKEFYALHNVSFHVEMGESVGIVGLNGSGKSTLLQVLAGVLQPTSGTYSIKGKIAALLELGAGFNSEFTGRENVYLNGSILGIPHRKMEERFQEVAEFAEIGEFIEQPVKTYSSGMVVRLAFAVLTQIDPDVLIIDEALSVGDAYFSHKCARKIRQLRESGKTLLFVSHDPGTVKSLCDRAILLEKGMIVREGRSEDVLDYYNAVVARKEKDEEIRQIESETGRTLTRSGNHRAEFEEVELADESGEASRAFVSGSRCTLRAKISFKQAIPNPTFGILIKDRLGLEVFGTNTYYGSSGSALEIGEEVAFAEAKLSLNLGPGSYSLTVAVHSGAEHTDENYDWVDHAIVFDVLPKAGFHFIGTAALPCELRWL